MTVPGCRKGCPGVPELYCYLPVGHLGKHRDVLFRSWGDDHRDPRLDPRPRDVFFKSGKHLDFMRIVRRVKGEEVLYQDAFGQVCASTLGSFVRWVKDAEVLNVAGEPV